MSPDNRKRGRGGNPRPTTARRTPPPEATGAEAVYLDRIKTSGARIAVELNNGDRIEGVIQYFDRHMIKIGRPSGPHLFVRKDDIRRLEEED